MQVQIHKWWDCQHGNYSLSEWQLWIHSTPTCLSQMGWYMGNLTCTALNHQLCPSILRSIWHVYKIILTSVSCNARNKTNKNIVKFSFKPYPKQESGLNWSWTWNWKLRWEHWHWTVWKRWIKESNNNIKYQQFVTKIFVVTYKMIKKQQTIGYIKIIVSSI